jgi:hypothetical protein
MNTNGLAKQYDKLTPRERFALIMAALARDDELEGTRLFLAAPKKHYSAADYHGVAMSFFWLSGLHFMSVLDMAACYFEAFADLHRTRKKDEEEAFENVMALGYIFQTYLVGWRKFCADLNMDPEYVWRLLPGFDTIQRADSISGSRPDKSTPGAAFVEEGAARWLIRQTRVDEAVMDDEAVKAVRVVNADGMAATLHAEFERLIEKWG